MGPDLVLDIPNDLNSIEEAVEFVIILAATSNLIASNAEFIGQDNDERGVRTRNLRLRR